MDKLVKVTYQGPFPAVEIPTIGLTAEAGVAVAVPAAVADNLIAQGFKPPRGYKPPNEDDDKGEN